MKAQLLQCGRNLTEAEMVRAMCAELPQADLKAIGRSRGFAPEVIASRELLQHVFLSEQGVESALAALTPDEIAGLHLLHCLGEQVDLEFFQRIYPTAVVRDSYASYSERFKNLFQRVKVQLVQRGLLLWGTLPDTFYPRVSMLERRCFRLPVAFGALLPAPFPVRRVDPATAGMHRREVLRDKVMEILRAGSLSPGESGEGKSGRWRLENGQLLLGPGKAPFQARQLEDWQRARFAEAVGYSSKVQPKALWPVPLLLYALSRLRADEWLAPQDLLPWWKMALPGFKVPAPPTVCAAGYECGCVVKIESDGGAWFRLPQCAEAGADTAPAEFLEVGHPQRVGVRLERIPLAALERLAEIAKLEITEGGLQATPDLLRLSHARSETLADPLVDWLREHHPAFRTTLESIERRRGKVIVHDNLLIARVRDLTLRVALEKKFGAPGGLVALDREFVAFPLGLRPPIEAWMKKSGHVIKSVKSGKPGSAEQEEDDDD